VGLESVFNPNNPMQWIETSIANFEGKVHPLLKLPIYPIHQRAISGRIKFQQTLTAHLSVMLINTAYASVSAQNVKNRSELFEFFRHLRNASSHGNEFNFKSKEPSRPAEWRGKRIDETKKASANPLFGTACFSDYIAPSDAILLLWDIEQHIT